MPPTNYDKYFLENWELLKKNAAVSENEEIKQMAWGFYCLGKGAIMKKVSTFLKDIESELTI